MFRKRLIPVLLIKGGALVKSLRFRDHHYVGDPVNAVRIFSELEADELIVLDIDARAAGRTIDPALLRDIAGEATMPLSVGGGLRSLYQIHELVAAGCEKVVIATEAVANPDFVYKAVREFGSSTIAVCIDVRADTLGHRRVWSDNAGRASRFAPLHFARLMEEQGAGEILLQSIDLDGSMAGYDLNLTRMVADAVTVPVIALAGAGDADDCRRICEISNASAAAAGSAFVYYRNRGEVLITYPAKAGRPC
ncbi:MAG TPA: HisA/HisF-related TIM barrel protein [Novosphingobium sp.]|nr:HisA/HisF-related TIM barrel protein [Novosphingobium sp.]